jgi:Zn-finger nucleic acid-binding protein
MQAHGDSFQCDYCKSVYVPGKDDEGVSVLGEGPGDQCTICSLALAKASIAKTPILYCSKCRGMLISMDVFATLTDTLRGQQHASVPAPPADPGELQRKISCPHCHQGMEAYYYAGPGNVVIDSCETCSLIWLDHGELLRIARAPEYEEQVMDRDGGSDTTAR